MRRSPKGRTIEEVDGDPAVISARGREITRLGTQMIDSATTLEQIANGASGQKGLAVDKLKDVVGDTHNELRLAGQRYEPTGPAVSAYGGALAEVQPQFRRVVADCHRQWAEYLTAQSSIPAAPPAWDLGSVPDEQRATFKAEQDKASDAHNNGVAAADAAYQRWETSAGDFDSYYDTWEDAFDTAVDAIGKADSGGIEDGFGDEVDGFVASALEVLKYVGIALAIAALIIGGPIVAALAAAVAIFTLALTAYSYFRGHSSLGDLILAVVGVIPIGSLGKLFSAGKRLEFLTDIGGGLFTKAGWQAMGANLGHWGNALHAVGAGFSRSGLGVQGLLRAGRGAYRAAAGPYGAGLGNFALRFFTGKTVVDFNKFPDSWNILYGVYSASKSHITLVARDIPQAIGAAWQSWFAKPEPGVLAR